MRLEELRITTMRELEEALGAPVFWSADDVDSSLNEGYREMSDASEWYEIHRTVDILHSRPWYDARTVFYGQQILTIGRGFHVDTNRWLIPSSTGDLDATYARWEQVRPATPSRILRRGLWWFAYWPIHGADSGTIRQYATAIPPMMASGDESPGFPEVFHRGLVDYALSELLPQVGEVSKGMAAWRRYLSYESGLADYARGRGSIPQVNSHASDAGTSG